MIVSELLYGPGIILMEQYTALKQMPKGIQNTVDVTAADKFKMILPNWILSDSAVTLFLIKQKMPLHIIFMQRSF